MNPHQNQKPQLSDTGGLRDILQTVSVLFVSVLVAIGLITFVFQSYEVDGPSMENTLQNNDRLIVWKLPRTWARVTGHEYVPKRGDVVVFVERGLGAYGQPGERQLIKRVIGLPGERVEVKDGVVTVFNGTNPNGFQPDKTVGYSGIPRTEGYANINVGKDQIYVMGDNRPESLDSRVFGPVSLNDVVGKLAVRVLPIGDFERF